MSQIQLTPAQVVVPRVSESEITLTIKPALEAANLLDAPTLEFSDEDGGNTNPEGLLVAKGLAERVDGRSSRHVALIRKEPEPMRRIAVPKQDYDRLGLDLEKDEGELPEILVYAGDQTVAFARADSVSISVERPGE